MQNLNSQPKLRFIDTHCHSDFFTLQQFSSMRLQAKQLGVQQCIAVGAKFAQLRKVVQIAQQFGDGFALGVHPLYVTELPGNWLEQLQQLVQQQLTLGLLAIGEIGLDYFASNQQTEELKQLQQQVFVSQLKLASQLNLPVIIHSRKSVDQITQKLKQYHNKGGIMHAFNGSLQQAKVLIDLGYKLGFGGAMTYDRAKNLQRLAKQLPLSALVIETDSPDLPPQWLYVNRQQREQGVLQPYNTPIQLPQIAQYLADLRQMSLAQLSEILWQNSCQALSIK